MRVYVGMEIESIQFPNNLPATASIIVIISFQCVANNILEYEGINIGNSIKEKNCSQIIKEIFDISNFLEKDTSLLGKKSSNSLFIYLNIFFISLRESIKLSISVLSL